MKRRDFLRISSKTAAATAFVTLSGCSNEGTRQAASASPDKAHNDTSKIQISTRTQAFSAVSNSELNRLPPATPSEALNGTLLPKSPLKLSNNDHNKLLFQHGVASGDPLPNRVILWTRLTIPNQGNNSEYNRYDEHVFYWNSEYQRYRDNFKKELSANVFEQIHASADYAFEVLWEVARDPQMTDIVAHGYTKAKKSRDFTVKVDPVLPETDTTFYYRFKALGWTSPIGRTKTAPDYNDNKARVKMALFSCSDIESGHFNAYANVAKTKDIDAVLHVGDYIYETGYKLGSTERGHPHDNGLLSKPTELRSFRGRFSQYRLDPDLQECHRQHPFIVVWDDHEFRDNFHPHAWQNIKQNAPQAYEEWMPIRRISNPEDHDEFLLYRSFSYGNLLSLSMLDSRRYRSKPDASKTNDSSRSMLGEKQLNWLLDDLKQQEQRNCQWNVIGQQLIFSASRGGGKGVNEGYGDDIWNGYAHNRNQILNFVKNNNIKDFVVLSGDWHTGMAFDIVQDPFVPGYDANTGKGSLGVEIVSPAVTSAVYRDGGSDSAKNTNPHMRYHDDTHNGYVILEFTAEYCQSDFRLLNSLNKNDGNESNQSLRSYTGTNHLVSHTQQILVDINASELVSQASKAPKFA